MKCQKKIPREPKNIYLITIYFSFFSDIIVVELGTKHLTDFMDISMV